MDTISADMEGLDHPPAKEERRDPFRNYIHFYFADFQRDFQAGFPPEGVSKEVRTRYLLPILS
jgi:hypothetical protein